MSDQEDTPPTASSQHTTAEENEVLTLDETAELLRISRPTMLELVHRGDIPCRRVGRAWRFHRSTVLEWVAGNDRVARSARSKR